MQKEGKSVLHAAGQIDVLQVEQSPAKAVRVVHDEKLGLEHSAGAVGTGGTVEEVGTGGTLPSLGSAGSAGLMGSCRSAGAVNQLASAGRMRTIRAL